MHHDQSRGKRKTQKVCKKQVNLTKSEGKFKKVGEKKIISRNRGKCIKAGGK